MSEEAEEVQPELLPEPESLQEPESSREYGRQPIADLLEQLSLTPHDLVVVSTEQLTHKMVARAIRGRRLTSNTKGIVQRALNRASKGNYSFAQLFNYQ